MTEDEPEFVLKTASLESLRNVDVSPSADSTFELFGDARRGELWRLGRAFIKRTVASLLNESSPVTWVTPEELTIVTRTGLGRGMRPVVFHRGQAIPWKLALAHSAETIAVAVSRSNGVAVGVDIVADADVDSGSLAMWFGDAELASYESDISNALATAWAIKESLYKATNQGEPFRPRRYEVIRSDNGFNCFKQRRPLSLEWLRTRRRDSDVVVSVGVRPRSRTLIPSISPVPQAVG